MPSLPPVVAVCQDEQLKACLIREVGFWGKPEEVARMENYFLSSDMGIRIAAIDCIGIARSARAEHKLVEMYPTQPERVQLHTLKAVMQISSGNAVGFLVRAWADCTVMSVKLNLLLCLWNYSDLGKEEFARLENHTTGADRLQFGQVRAFTGIYKKSMA